VKNSKNRFVASGPTSAMIAGTWNSSALLRTNALSEIGAEDYLKTPKKDQKIVMDKRGFAE
jgi:hypothetical protein